MGRTLFSLIPSIIAFLLKTIDTMTTSHGSLIETRTAVLTAGKRGPMLLQDSVFLDELMKFDRERIPERVVHAKGAAAFGYFVVTNDITKYTKASIFAKIGKRTPCFFRFSTVGGLDFFLKDKSGGRSPNRGQGSRCPKVKSRFKQGVPNRIRLTLK
ncbi:unnamed protein product [Meloidogyne enterolobii]|uniref:Uncharacterized protein n=1 Tax=Meloidogyne enterolobii TaxID=390850 RepID=A0ACB0Z571_MELEN